MPTLSSDKLQSSTKPKEQSPTKWQPPRGIRLIDLSSLAPNRPHGVQWRLDGRRKTKGFPTKEQQVEFARGLAQDVKSIGVAAYRLGESEARDWRAFVAQIGGNTSLDLVLRCWQRYGGGRDALTVSKAVEQFLAAKEAEGLSKNTLAHYRPVYDRLTAEFGPRDVSSIEREDIAAWQASLGVMSPYSVRTHIIRTRALFRWLKLNRSLAESPCDGVKPPRIIKDNVTVMPLADAIELFKQNKGEAPELCGRLALEAFCGFRFASACQIVPADIDWTALGLVLPAEEIKTRRRQFIDGLPDNLWAWLKWSDPASWKMTNLEYMKAKSAAFVRARIPHPHNVLRHSFASYHMAGNKDASRTAAILCHTSPKMLYSHYKGRATAADGAAYFQIMP